MFKKSSDGVNIIDTCLGNFLEGTGTGNQVAPSHGTPSGSFIIVADVGEIP